MAGELGVFVEVGGDWVNLAHLAAVRVVPVEKWWSVQWWSADGTVLAEEVGLPEDEADLAVADFFRRVAEAIAEAECR